MTSRIIATACVSLFALAAFTGTSYAHFCTNASKPAGAGQQAVFDVNTESYSSFGKSYQNQIDRAGKSPEELKGGFVGVDVNGDGEADADTYNPPMGVIPAAFNDQGNPCKGVTNFEALAGC